MPGAARRFEFKEQTPRVVIVATLLLFANLLSCFVVDLWVHHFAPQQPTRYCDFQIQLKAGVAAFVP